MAYHPKQGDCVNDRKLTDAYCPKCARKLVFEPMYDPEIGAWLEAKCCDVKYEAYRRYGIHITKKE